VLSNTLPADEEIRVVVHPGAQMGVQAVPAPAGAGPFRYDPPKESDPTRTILLDPIDVDMDDRRDNVDLRLYKTTNRAIYDEATTRAGETLLRRTQTGGGLDAIKQSESLGSLIRRSYFTPRRICSRLPRRTLRSIPPLSHHPQYGQHQSWTRAVHHSCRG
jgi:hypothetical protein